MEDGPLGDLLRSTEAGRLALRILSPEQEMPPGQVYLREIVSGTICADLLDYLKRDNYFCGLCYEFDERIFQYFRVADGRLALDMEQDGFFRRDALSETTNLLRIRYVLSERVYYHHAKIAAGVMISKAVERALAAGLSEEDLCTLTDGGLIYRLRERFGEDAALSELLDDFEMRRLFKRCYVVSRGVGEEKVAAIVRSYHLNEGAARDRAERRIADALGTEPHRVAVYCAPAGMALKEADVPVIVPRPRGGTEMTLLSALNSDEIQVLKRQHQSLWKMFVFLSPELSDRVPEAGRVCEEVIGHPNELPVETAGADAGIKGVVRCSLLVKATARHLQPQRSWLPSRTTNNEQRRCLATPLPYLALCVSNPFLAGTSPRRCQTLPLRLVV